MAFTRQYKEFLKPEVRVSKSLIKPRNIYRISTYSGGDPITKQGDDARYVFVIGKVGDKIHCIKLNEIKPIDFTQFIGKLRDKIIPLTENQMVHLFLKKFATDGNSLFETYVKNNSKIYSKSLGNYRTYFIDKIVNVWEIRFELDFLQDLFGEVKTPSQQRTIIEEEIDEND